MKSKSVAKWQREKIALRMTLRASYDARLAIAKAESDLAERLRRWMFGKHFEAVEAMPAGFFRADSGLHVSVIDGACQRRHSYLYFGEVKEKEKGVKFEISHLNRRVPNHQKIPDIKSDDRSEVKFANELLDHIIRSEEVEEKRKTLHRSIEASLERLTTTKKLHDTWPEAYEAYVELFGEDEAAKGLPAVPVDHLRAMMKGFPDAVAA